MPTVIPTLWIRGLVEAVSPIVHFGDEKTGSTPILRALQHWSPERNAFVRLPYISGNAVRGVLRRLLMADFVSRIGYTITSPKLHHALFTGGLLESTTDAEGVIDLAFRARVRDLFPPLALLGTVIGNQMIPSSLRAVSHLVPLCAEYRPYLPEQLQADPRCAHPVRAFTDFAFETRRDDLRAEREQDEQAMQMLIQFEAFVPGTAFASSFCLSYATELEVSCFGHALQLWAEKPFLGGKAGSGFGQVRFQYEPWPDSTLYQTYCAEKAEQLRHGLDEIAERLGG